MREGQQKISSKKRHHEVENHTSKKTKYEENGVATKEQPKKEKGAKDANLSANQVFILRSFLK